MPKEQDAKCTAAAQKDLFERRHEPVGEDQRSNTQVLLRRWCRRARSARRCMTSWRICSRQRPTAKRASVFMLLFLAVVIGMWSVFSTTRFFPLILLTVVAREHTWIEVFTEEALERGKVFSAQERGSGFQLADGFMPEVSEALHMPGFFEALNCGGSRSGGGGSYGRDPDSVFRASAPSTDEAHAGITTGSAARFLAAS